VPDVVPAEVWAAVVIGRERVSLVPGVQLANAQVQPPEFVQGQKERVFIVTVEYPVEVHVSAHAELVGEVGAELVIIVDVDR